MDIPSVRDYLLKYQRDAVLDGISTLKNGAQPSDWIRDNQRQTLDGPDEHVIPLADYEIRIGGRDPDLERNSRYLYCEDNIERIEAGWDDLVAEFGLEGVSFYRPFHTDISTSGIYINQRGLRYLGHLLYHWSKAVTYSTSKTEAIDILQRNTLQEGHPAFQSEPAFEDLEAAIELAQEIFLRYQWFHHQFELFTAYVEDARGELLYEEYAERTQDTPRRRATRPAAHLAAAAVRRSQACQSRAPDGHFIPLFVRTTSVLPNQGGWDLNKFISRDQFENECRNLAGSLYQTPSTGTDIPGQALASQLPFQTDIRRIVGQNLSAFITRREDDSDVASYALNEHPLTQAWTVETDPEWDEAYEQADGSVQTQIDSLIQKLDGRPKMPETKGDGIGPKNVYYDNLTDGMRYVFGADEQNRQITLLAFGDHDIPKDFGLHVK